MRLVRVDEHKYQQGKAVEASTTAAQVDKNVSAVAQNAAETDDAYRNRPITTLENNFYVDVLLRRRSLYIMRYVCALKWLSHNFKINFLLNNSQSSRYNFTHEILGNDMSHFQGQQVKKDRRISIICRNDP